MKKILLLLLVSSMFMLSLSAVNASEYDEIYDLNNSWIDGNRDNKYELLHNSTTEQIWFAHSSTRYAFYIESNESLSKININSTTLTGDFSDANVIAKFSGNHSEIVLTRANFGEKVAFVITINNGSIILLDPLDALVPITTTDTTTPTDTNTTTNATTPQGIDLVAAFGNIFSSPVFWMLLAFFIIILADYNNHPVVKCMDQNGKLVHLGRFITETNEPLLNKKKFLFMGLKGVQEIYCDYSFRALDIFCFQRVYVIQWDYPHLILTKLNIPGKSNFKKKEIVKHWENYILWGLFKVICFTPFRFLGLKLYNSLKTKDVTITDVDYLIPYITMNALEYRFDIKYQQEELDTEKNELKFIEKEQKSVIYSDILALKKSKIKELKISLANVENIKYPTLKDAQEDKHSRFETINAYENRTTALEINIFDLEKRLQNAYNTITKQRIETDEKIRDGLKPMEESAEYLRQNFPDMLSMALRLRPLSLDENECIQRAIIAHIDKRDNEKEALRLENVKLQAKLEKSSKKQSDPFNPNVITIKNEKNEKGESDE